MEATVAQVGTEAGEATLAAGAEALKQDVVEETGSGIVVVMVGEKVVGRE